MVAVLGIIASLALPNSASDRDQLQLEAPGWNGLARQRDVLSRPAGSVLAARPGWNPINRICRVSWLPAQGLAWHYKKLLSRG